MGRVLLIADLEGITGVDSSSAIAFGAPSYPAAAKRMTDEVALVARLLLERGVGSIVVSDAHRSGADTNLDRSLLPRQCEVRVEDDMYGGALLDGVEAVVCVGMHARAGSAGFCAHTVAVNASWTLGEQPLTETHLALFLAAERGVPIWCASGDDVLEQQLHGLVPFVRTKQALSVTEARSLPLGAVEAHYGRVLAGPPAAIPRVPREVLRLRFRDGPRAEVAAGESFQRQYEAGLALMSSPEVNGVPGTPEFAHSAVQLLLEPWEA